MSYSEQQEKQCEDYLKETTHCKIVRAFGKYIILAHDESDFNMKARKIARGETLGFYLIERVLMILNNNTQRKEK